MHGLAGRDGGGVLLPDDRIGREEVYAVEAFAGAVLAGRIHHVRADQPVAEPDRIMEHVDQHHVAQQPRYLRGLDVLARRHPALAALGEPVGVDLVHLGPGKRTVHVSPPAYRLAPSSSTSRPNGMS